MASKNKQLNAMSYNQFPGQLPQHVLQQMTPAQQQRYQRMMMQQQQQQQQQGAPQADNMNLLKAKQQQTLQQIGQLPPHLQQQLMAALQSGRGVPPQLVAQLQQFKQSQGAAQGGRPQGSPQVPQGMPQVPQGVPQGMSQIPQGISPVVPGLNQPAAPSEPIGFPQTAPGERIKQGYWSSKLKAKGEEVPTDVLLYEQIVHRDIVNMKNMLKERNGTEPVAEGDGLSNKEFLVSLQNDLRYYSELKNTRLESITNTNHGRFSKSIWGPGYEGYGHGVTNTVTRVVLPQQRKRYSRVPEGYWSHEELKKAAATETELVPIRLEFDSERDKFRLRDTFMWNKNESLVALEHFVAMMMEDYRFANPLFADVVLNSIKEQLAEYQPRIYSEADLRIIIKLDIVIGNNQLVDQFEWDIANKENSPEEFAEVMCAELSLPPEFSTAIAHAIHEQVQMYTRALHLVGYDGQFVDDDEIRSHMRPPVTIDDVIRTDVKKFTPNVLAVTHLELDRLDKDKDRDTRRKRRQVRGGRGAAARAVTTLPDLSDIPKTFRIPVPTTVLPGGLDLGPGVQSFQEVATMSVQQPDVSRLPRRRRVQYQHDPGYSCVVRIKL